MKVLLDTSVIVAGTVPSHASHAVSLTWLEGAKRNDFESVISTHSIAECFAVLTRLPLRPRITGQAVRKLLDDLLMNVNPVGLTASDYLDLLDDLTTSRLVGGVVYDGVIVKAAQLEDVDYLITLNEADFHRLWPAEASRIVSPLTFSPP